MTLTQRAIAAALCLATVPGAQAASKAAPPHAEGTRKAAPPHAVGTRKAAPPRLHGARKTVAHHRPAPPLSYLRYNSYSVDEVIRQLQDNPKLRQRYANHFHIPPDQVIPYFRQNLVESYIPRTRRYPVWMARPNGTKYVAYQTFRAGTRVLSLRNGDPVLKWACGNPLTRHLPTIKKRVVQRPPKVLPKVEKKTRYVDIETPFETPRPLPGLPPAYLPPASTLNVLTRTAVVPVASRFPLAALLPLGLIHGGGGGSTPPAPPPIPEPSTLALLATGLLASGLVFIKRK